jgi:hypothetical protein
MYCLLVRNFGFDTTDAILTAFFKSHGVTTANVHVVTNKGYGFVYVAKNCDPDEVISLVDNKLLNGRPVKVVISKNMELMVTGGDDATALTSFASLCTRRMKKRVVEYKNANWFAELPKRHITALTILNVPAEDDGDNFVSVQFLVLPEGFRWPSFLDRKQNKACGRRVVLEKKCIRYTAINKEHTEPVLSHDDKSHEGQSEFGTEMGDDRCDEDPPMRLDVLRLYPADDVPRFAALRLLQKNSVVFVGHPGVGKSVEVNIVLYHLLHELAGRNMDTHSKDTVGNLKKVFLRVGLLLFCFYISNTEDGIRCEEIPDCGQTLLLVDQYFGKYPKTQLDEEVADDAILVLELQPGETNPHITRVPVLIALSSGDVEVDLMSMTRKDDEGCDLVMRPPHSPEALIALSLALCQTDGDKYLKRIGLPVFAGSGSSSGSSSALSTSSSIRAQQQRERVCNLIRERIQAIGPLARQVLNSKRNYLNWRECSQDVNTADMFLEDLHKTSVYRLPNDAMYLVAPYSLDDIRFLSEPCCRLVGKTVEAQNVEAVVRRGLDWQIAEAVILNYFIMKNDETPVPYHWNFRNWEFCVNPKHDYYLGSKDLVSELMKEHIIMSSIGHTRKVYFKRSQLPLACEDMDAETVYLSTMATMPVGEFLTYDKKTNCITLYQTSTIAPSKHPFTVTSLQRYTQGGKVNIRIIFFVSWHIEKLTGVRIIKSAKEKDITLTDDEVCRYLYGNGAGRYSAFIVRCGIYDSTKLPAVLLGETFSFEDYVRIWIKDNDAVSVSMNIEFSS